MKNVNSGKEKQMNSKVEKSWRIIGMLRILFVLTLVAVIALFPVWGKLNRDGNLMNPIVYAIALLIQTRLFLKTSGKAAKIEKKTAFIPMLIGIIVFATGMVIGIMNPVYDYWYYGMAILCFLGMLANMISMINYLNYLTTRPVPDFFRREGADHGN